MGLEFKNQEGVTTITNEIQRLGNINDGVNDYDAVNLKQLGQLLDYLSGLSIAPTLDVFVLNYGFTSVNPYKNTNGPDYDNTFPAGAAKIYQSLVRVNRGHNMNSLTVVITGNSVVWGNSTLRTLTFSAGESMGNHFDSLLTLGFTSTVITYSLYDGATLLDVKTITLTGSGGGSGSGSGTGSGGGGSYTVTGGSSIMDFSESGGVQSPPDTYAINLAKLDGLNINGTGGLDIRGGQWTITHTSGNAYTMVLVSGSAKINGVIPVLAATLTIVSLSSAYPATIGNLESFAVSGSITV